MIYEDPQFININTWDFNVSESSPCINSGSPNITDEDGTISDIGAVLIGTDACSNQGDLNNDSLINVVDIVQVVGCILDNSCSDCGDVNIDGNIDVIDIVMMVNIILSE